MEIKCEISSVQVREDQKCLFHFFTLTSLGQNKVCTGHTIIFKLKKTTCDNLQTRNGGNKTGQL